MWRRYLKLAHGYTAAHPDGIVRYTAHELRHVCASLLIASGASDVQVAHQMGHSKIETTKNIYAPEEDVIAAVVAHHARRSEQPPGTGHAPASYRPESLSVLFGPGPR